MPEPVNPNIKTHPKDRSTCSVVCQSYKEIISEGK